jgi:hypothetical protein
MLPRYFLDRARNCATTYVLWNYWRTFGHPIDRYNKRNYGSDAPRHAELIYVNPKEITGALLMPSRVARKESGTVVEIFPPHGARIVDIRDIPEIGICLQHWLDGVPWSDCSGQGDGRKFVMKKWKKYDSMLTNILAFRELKTRKEMFPKNFRETGGVVVHIDSQGRFYHGNGGNRRFSAALIADLDMIPAMVGYVHVGALDLFKRLRQPSNPATTVSSGHSPSGPKQSAESVRGFPL